MCKNIPIVLLWIMCLRISLNNADNQLSCAMDILCYTETNEKCKLEDESWDFTPNCSLEEVPSSPRCHNVTATRDESGVQFVITWSGPANGSLLRGFQIQLMGVDDNYPIRNYKLDLGENDSRFSGSQHFSSLQEEIFQMTCNHTGDLFQQIDFYIYSLPMDCKLDSSCSLSFHSRPIMKLSTKKPVAENTIVTHDSSNGVTVESMKTSSAEPRTNTLHRQQTSNDVENQKKSTKKLSAEKDSSNGVSVESTKTSSTEPKTSNDVENQKISTKKHSTEKSIDIHVKYRSNGVTVESMRTSSAEPKTSNDAENQIRYTKKLSAGKSVEVHGKYYGNDVPVENRKRSTKKSSAEPSTNALQKQHTGVIILLSTLTVVVGLTIVIFFSRWIKKSPKMSHERESGHFTSTSPVQDENIFTSIQSDFDQSLFDQPGISLSERDQSGSNQLLCNQSEESLCDDNQPRFTKSVTDQSKGEQIISDQSEVNESIYSIPIQSEFSVFTPDQPISILYKRDQSISGQSSHNYKSKSVRFNIESFDCDQLIYNEPECPQSMEDQFSVESCFHCLVNDERWRAFDMEECSFDGNSESQITDDDIKRHLLQINFPDVAL
ncbi:uncharacterized protein LOC111128160 isoform X2 [Crassostrea virginica]